MQIFKPRCAVCRRHVDTVDVENTTDGVQVLVVRCHGAEERQIIGLPFTPTTEFHALEAFKVAG